jgi:NitT/TauT family transport system permease protein/taurine transport system permease protein
MSGWQAPPLSVLAPEDSYAISGEAETDEISERADLIAHRRARRRAKTRRVLTGLAGLVTLILLWQIAAMIIDDQVALPSVVQTVQEFAHYLNRPYPTQGSPIWYDLYISTWRVLIGFVLGVLAGVTIGAAMSVSQVVRHLVDPVIEVLRPLPPLAFIPLFIVWLGIGELPKEVLIIVGVTPLMAIVTVAALGEVPEDLRLCARTLGASRGYTLLHVQIRSALPSILTGMRIAMAGSWSSIVAVEMIAATSGLGYMITQAGDYLNLSLAFAGLIAIAVISLALDACLRGLLVLADPSRRG